MDTFGNELNLPDIKILEKEETNGILHYSILPQAAPNTCPFCKSIHISKYGPLTRTLKDAPIYGTPVILHVCGNRYKCTKCNKVFTNPLAFADTRDKITSRLKQQVENHCLRDSVTELSEEYNVSVATISRITNEYVERLEKSWTNYTPEVLALTDIHLGKSKRVLCIDAERNGIVDLFEKSDKKSLISALENRFNFEEIDSAVIDFNRSHYTALKSVCRDLTIVIGAEYVRTRVVSAVRAELRGTDGSIVNLILKGPTALTAAETEKVKKALKDDPHAQRIADIKNLFFEMYRWNSLAEAEKRFETICRLVSQKDVYLFDLVGLINEFQTEVFNIFGSNYSFDAIQNAQKLVNKVEKKGAGFSYKNLRARLLFSKSARQARNTVIDFSPAMGNTFSALTGFNGLSLNQSKTHEIFLGNYADLGELLEIWSDEQ